MLNQTEVPKKHTLPSLLNLDNVSSVKTPSKPSHYKPASLLTPAYLSAKHSRNASPYNAKTPGKTPAPTLTPANKSMSPKSKTSSVQQPEESAVKSSRLKDMNNKTLRQARQCLESRPLKKLYTASMHEQYTGKLDDLKRKYDHVYKYVVKDQPEILDPSKERIKDVVLKSENLFNTTYSIKYFGVKDDQIGILSKRVNMNQKNTARQNRTTEIERGQTGDNRPSILIDRTYQGPGEGFQRHEGTLTNFGNSTTTPKAPGSSKNKLKSITQGIRDYDKERTSHQESSSSKDEGLISRVKNARRSLEVSVPGNEDDYFKNYSQNVYGMIPQHITESEHESLDGMMHTQGASFGSKEVNRQFEDPEDRQEESNRVPGRNTRAGELYGYQHGNKEATAFLTAKSPDGYMITKYVLPKKLQAPKRVERAGRKLTGLQKMVKAPEEDNIHHFERNLKSLPKVKRTLLRSLEAKGQAEEYKDDLNALEKYRTNELNNLIAGVTKYSYSKLLETLAFGPFGVEKVFEEKNKNLEEVFKSRKQKKAMKNADINVNASTGRMSKGSSTVNGWFKDKIDEIEEMYTHAENFDLKVECDDTEMLNTYLKVRNGIK